jgi:histone-lysine N-methyltransferase SETMAR
VQKWAQRFREGRETVTDDPRCGAPRTAITDFSINRVDEIVNANPHASVEDIAEEANLSTGSTHTILKEHLRLRKLHDRWVPHILKAHEKENRMETARSVLNRMRRWGDCGVRSIVTGDETYLRYYEPASRAERTSWRHSNDPPSTSLRPSAFTEKVLYIFFFSCEGEVTRIVVPKESTVTGTYYCAKVLPQVERDFRALHPNLQLRLHDDNAPAHRCHNVLDYLEDHGIVRVPHPPYSPDLAPCDFWLFPKLKSHLRGQTFSDRQSLGRAVGQAIRDIPGKEWAACFEQWKRRLKLCVEHNGEYFEALM